ncbi:MAG: hypothetical protein IJ358_02950 [Clostridia bacterium]|nr:hypothetical protein [Clostridia bacterium]
MNETNNSTKTQDVQSQQHATTIKHIKRNRLIAKIVAPILLSSSIAFATLFGFSVNNMIKLDTLTDELSADLNIASTDVKATNHFQQE